MEIDGVTGPGKFAPVIREVKLRVLDHRIEVGASIQLRMKAAQIDRELVVDEDPQIIVAAEREDLEAFVELSETISLIRAQALRLLGRKPL